MYALGRLATGDDTRYLFLINHNAIATKVNLRNIHGVDCLLEKDMGGEISLEPYGVRIISI